MKILLALASYVLVFILSVMVVQNNHEIKRLNAKVSQCISDSQTLENEIRVFKAQEEILNFLLESK